MIPTCFSRLEIEKSLLHFLALTLGRSGQSNAKLKISCGNEKPVFEKLDITQERGRLPMLVLYFTFGSRQMRAEYFGHIAPAKLGCVTLYEGQHVLEEYHFSRPGKLYDSELLVRMDKLFPDAADAKGLIASLYLWRSCIGLSMVCAEDLKKYFSKMKSISRFEWVVEEITVKGVDIHEYYVVDDVECREEKCSLHVHLRNGIVENVVL